MSTDINAASVDQLKVLLIYEYCASDPLFTAFLFPVVTLYSTNTTNTLRTPS